MKEEGSRADRMRSAVRPRRGRERVARAAWKRAAHEGQTAPDGDWRTWVFLGGRGAGKTRAGAEWVSEVAARLGAGGRIALVGATMHDVRAVMLEGPSGLMNLPFRTAPRLEASRRRVVFPGGAVGVMLSAAEPERLRGPQFHAAWGDEFCAWERPEEALAMLRLGLRLGHPGGAIARDAVPRCLSADGDAIARLAEPRCLSADAAAPSTAARSPSPMKGEERWRPRLLLTTTPKPVKALRGVLAEGSCARTHAPTRANAANLAEGFVEDMLDLYGGTRRAAQELEGVVLEAAGALFGHADMERARALGRSWRLGGERAPYERAVVAVDPPAGTLSGEGGDACGIVVVARAAGTAWVLEDASVAGLSPMGWAGRVKRTADRWAAALDCPVRVVAEANQGGAMVEAVLKAAGLTQTVRRVAATAGKRARAEPVAALYEQGRVGHLGDLTALEEELMGLGEDGGGASPDRADALVWAVTDLMLTRTGDGPRVSWV
ncbi:terminase large subunit domain-containing protein [Brevundimonas bacteroides]|uniref:terminase large subunit domain-containing protein n=1 Tax=Brevundimonas bacteroides TaxID=74311 RepID=UPI00068CE37D|nr:terminase family protein [Brevundimonas bacteroides]